MWKYEYIDHTADLAIKICATTIEEIFKGASFCMFDSILELNKINCKKKIKISLTDETVENILFAFLKNLLDRFYTKNFITKNIKKLVIKNKKLKAIVCGDYYNEKKYGRDIFKHEIKSITYHNLKIEKINNEYTVTIIFDI